MWSTSISGTKRKAMSRRKKGVWSHEAKSKICVSATFPLALLQNNRFDLKDCIAKLINQNSARIIYISVVPKYHI